MISFFARNGVAANLLLALIVISGASVLYLRKIPLEVFPEFESQYINVSVPYRGATPANAHKTMAFPLEPVTLTSH